MKDLKSNAEFYFSDKYNLTKQQCIKDIAEYLKLKQDFKDRKVTPSQVIGTGYKPQYVRKIAAQWINDQLEMAKYLLSNFDTDNKLTKSQRKECDNPHCIDGVVGESYGEKLYCNICK